jgi:hypothetical protein
MLLNLLCSPALIYVIFVLIHIITEIQQKKYDRIMSRLLIGLLFTSIIQVLCIKGLSLIAWLLVSIPIILYVYTTMIIYFVFGINPEDRVKHYQLSNNN